MRGRKCSGYITVYLSLTLAVMTALITTMLTGARIKTIRFQTECVMDMGLESIFAEYNREMQKRYGLLFIDSSYCGDSASGSREDAVKSHLLHYMNLNFDCNKGSLINRDLTAAHADNALMEGVAYASDNTGEVLRYQIDRYMKVKYGAGYLPLCKNNEVDMDSMLGCYDDYHSERTSAGDTVDSIIDEYNSTLDEDEEPYSISNPADSVEDMSGSNVLFYALGDTGDIPFKRTDIGTLISHRGYTQGAGLRAHQSPPSGPDAKLLLIDYIYDCLGYYEHEKDGSALMYEVEYILEGHDSDIENMEDIAGRIFKLRYVVNMSYLMSSSSKQAEAEALAIAATSALALPELAEAVKYTILFAWGYAESAKDLRILYDGHSLCAAKSDSTWNTPLEQMVDFKTHLSEYSVYGGELDYKAFLDMFLIASGTDRLTMRLMDVMEMDLRLTPGNAGYKMDEQVYQLTATANVSSRYGYACSIKRYYSYE